jgi:hypothetical protein
VRPEIVRFVVVAYELLRATIVPDATKRSVIVVVASVETPLTWKVPCERSDEVATIFPPVIELKIAVTPLTRLVKKLVDVALSKNAFTA